MVGKKSKRKGRAKKKKKEKDLSFLLIIHTFTLQSNSKLVPRCTALHCSPQFYCALWQPQQGVSEDHDKGEKDRLSVRSP